ncbi:MAG: hypothetical protein HYY16_05595 [Planctomycetes bacterium]|nr:hypothetical protein [Planctomycetota bacterium]
MELLYSWQESDELYRGRRREANPDDVSTTFQQETIHLSWKALDEIELNLLLPRVEIHNESVGQEDVDLEGLGDVSLFVDWGPWRGTRRAETEEESLLDPRGLALIVGLKFPTGEENDDVVPGVTPPSLLQLGTGTYDPLLGLQYRGRTGDFTVFHRTSVQLSGGASEAGLKPGNVLQTATGVAYELFDRVTPSLAIEALFRDKDELNGDTINNTGSSFWFVTPAISVRIVDHLYLDGAVRIPIYRDVDRTQLVPGELWTVGLSASF